MGNKISFFQKIIRSFNPGFSKEVIKLSLKEGFKYLCLLTILITLILSFKFSLSFYFSTKNLAFRAKDFLSENFKDFPEITIKDGKLSSTKDPFLKEWDINGAKAAFIVDTKADKQDIVSGKYSPYPLGLFLLEKEFTVKTIDEKEGERIENYPLPTKSDFNLVFNPQEDIFLRAKWNNEKFELTPQVINKWKTIANLVSFPFLLVILFTTFFIGKIFQVLIFSIVSLIANGLSKTKLTYKQLFNIGIFSLTIPFLLENIISLLSIRIPNFNIFNLLIYLGLLITSVLKTKSTELQKVES